MAAPYRGASRPAPALRDGRGRRAGAAARLSRNLVCLAQGYSGPGRALLRGGPRPARLRRHRPAQRRLRQANRSGRRAPARRAPGPGAHQPGEPRRGQDGGLRLRGHLPRPRCGGWC
ncbi:MAG: hypothetical protein WKG07_12065 [Hymenobacter sp.]